MPFNVNSESVRPDLQLELIELQSNNHLKQLFLMHRSKNRVLQVVIENKFPKFNISRPEN